MIIKNVMMLMLSATYWRYRRQRENHSESLFWAKLVISAPFFMTVINAARWLVQTSEQFRYLRNIISNSLLLLVPILWFVGWLMLHWFVRNNAAVYRTELSSEEYSKGNISTVLFMTFGVVFTIYTALALGRF